MSPYGLIEPTGRGEKFQISQIYVPKSAYDSEDHWEVVDSLSVFAGRCQQEGGFISDELPNEVLINSQLTAVWVQIYHNGTMGYVHNTILNGLAADKNRPYFLKEVVDKGFSLIGSDEHQALFRRVWALFEQNRSIFEELYESGKFYEGGYISTAISKDIKEQAAGLDSEWFWSDNRETENIFLQRRVSWIRSLDNIFALDAEKYENEMRQLFSSNPVRQERLDELESLRLADQAELDKINEAQATTKAEIFRRGLHPSFFRTDTR